MKPKYISDVSRCFHVAIGLILALFMLSDLIYAGESSLQKPELNIGDRWDFEYLEDRVKGEDFYCKVREKDYDYFGTKIYILESNENGEDKEFYLTKELNSIANYRDGELRKTFDPERKALNFMKLKVGEKWTKPYEWTKRNKIGETVDSERRSGDFSVVRYGDVTVPAGTFKAYEIEEHNGGTVISRHWYAPDVKFFVKREFRNKEWLLKSYSVK